MYEQQKEVLEDVPMEEVEVIFPSAEGQTIVQRQTCERGAAQGDKS